MIALLTLVAVAQEPADLEGRWIADPSAVTRAVDQATEDAARQFSMLIRPLARPRLRQVPATADALHIDVDGDFVTTRSALREGPWRSDLAATPVTVRKTDGAELRLERSHADGLLTEIACAEDGCSTWTYRLDGGALVVHRTLRSSHFAEPVELVVRYRRHAD